MDLYDIKLGIFKIDPTIKMEIWIFLDPKSIGYPKNPSAVN